MVASPRRDAGGTPRRPSSPPRHVPPGSPGERASDGPPSLDGHRGEDIRRALCHLGFPAEVANCMSNKWSSSTTPGYATSWRHWLDFCQRIGFNPVCGPDLKSKTLRHIADFLTEEIDRGMSGGTVHNTRASICGVYELLLGERKLAKHPWLAAVAKAAKIARPAQPRYEDIWDASTVVQYWASHPAPSLELKRARAVSLGLLALFARPSDLARISRLEAHWQALPDRFRFRIRGPKEAKNAATLSPWIELRFMPAADLDDDVMGCCSCAGRAWAAYFSALQLEPLQCLPLEAERFPRGRFLALSPQAFAGYPGLWHTPLSAERISKIMKDVMTKAGVDTSVFKGGSGRHAGSSAAAAKGDHLLDVMKTARWSSFQTFKKFYLRARITEEQRRAVG